MDRKIIVSGVGCCLVDRIYNNVSFTTGAIGPYLSKKNGDGGLVPGQLVFKEEFEGFSGEKLQTVLTNITGTNTPDKLNIGGPCIVALLHASQVLEPGQCTVRFFGLGGDDEDGRYLLSELKNTQVDIQHYQLSGDHKTPSTVVFSDPDFDKGNGERAFINSIGAAWDYSPASLGKNFFSSDIVVFGGTALVPQIHDNLDKLLGRSKANGCITVVNTVYDFRNEKADPTHPWPLGKSDVAYRFIDLLITDREEALRLSGKDSVSEAFVFFRGKGVGALVVTNGSNPVRAFSAGGPLKEIEEFELPVSRLVSGEIKKGVPGDTTGCGDNFVGGVLASLVRQLYEEKGYKPDLKEACFWGIVSGGFSCLYVGGMYREKYPGEKRELIQPYFEQYIKDTGHGQ